MFTNNGISLVDNDFSKSSRGGLGVKRRQCSNTVATSLLVDQIPLEACNLWYRNGPALFMLLDCDMTLPKWVSERLLSWTYSVLPTTTNVITHPTHDPDQYPP